MRRGVNFLILVCSLAIITVIGSCSKDASGGTDSKEAKPFAKGFSGADGITIDYEGNMYVGNRNTNLISKVNKKGEAQDFVKLECSELLCMTADEDNNIYAAGTDKVFKINPGGEIIELAAGFTCADDLRLDLKGNLYVTDSFENIVYRITPSLEKSIFIDSDVSREELGTGWHITGITFDSSCENLYIARMKKGEILKYSIGQDCTPGAPRIIIKDLPEPDHLEMDEEGRLYITLFRSGTLIRVDNEGKENIEYLSNGEMGYATGIVLGRSGFDEKSAYVADYGKNIVFKIKVE